MQHKHMHARTHLRTSTYTQSGTENRVLLVGLVRRGGASAARVSSSFKQMRVCFCVCVYAALVKQATRVQEWICVFACGRLFFSSI